MEVFERTSVSSFFGTARFFFFCFVPSFSLSHALTHKEVDAYFEGLGTASGLGGDQVKYLVCLLLAIPLGLIFARLPHKKMPRQLFGMFWGLLFCFFCLGRFAWIHSFFTSTVAWIIMKVSFARMIGACLRGLLFL